MGAKRILTENAAKHFTKEELRKRQAAEQQVKDIGLSFKKAPKVLSGCKYGKELYDVCYDALLDKGLLNDQTYNTFGILCYNYHMYIVACEDTKNLSKRLNVKKVLALSEEDFKMLMKLKENAKDEEVMYFKHFRQLCNDFGFTPASLLKLMDSTPQSKKEKTSVGVKLFG